MTPEEKKFVTVSIEKNGTLKIKKSLTKKEKKGPKNTIKITKKKLIIKIKNTTKRIKKR